MQYICTETHEIDLTTNTSLPSRPATCWKRVFPQTFNAIANCLIILRSWAYPHDIHNLPLDEHIGNLQQKQILRFEKEKTRRFRTKAQLGPNARESTGNDQVGFRIAKASEIRQNKAGKLQFPETSQKSHLRSIWKNNCSMWPSIIVRIQEMQFKFRKGNKTIRMQIRNSPSLWSSDFKIFKFSNFPLF